MRRATITERSSGRILVTLAVLALCSTPRAQAADWSFFVAPYGWLASIAGKAVTNGRETDLDVSFQDLLENTSGAFQLYAEARRDKLFVAFDWTWATLKSENEGNLANLEVRVDQRLPDFRLGYEVHRRALNESEADDPLALREKTTDIFVGARYFKTEPRLTLSLPVGDPITTVSTNDRWDPFIGFRTGRDLSKRWGFGVRG